MIEATYEGYGPGGTAIMLETLSDNRNRTVSDIRSTLTKAGGNLAQAGAVAWQFETKGLVVLDAEPEQVDDLTLIAIDAGADDFEAFDSTLRIYSAPERLEEIRRVLDESGASIQSSELTMIPTNMITLEDKVAVQTLKLIDRLEDLDDVQKVYFNADFPDEALELYGSEQ
jgi:YebC/PmpR family DNA-binding regulatory protein